jgi:hypothetical protein
MAALHVIDGGTPTALPGSSEPAPGTPAVTGTAGTGGRVRTFGTASGDGASPAEPADSGARPDRHPRRRPRIGRAAGGRPVDAHPAFVGVKGRLCLGRHLKGLCGATVWVAITAASIDIHLDRPSGPAAGRAVPVVLTTADLPMLALTDGRAGGPNANVRLAERAYDFGWRGTQPVPVWLARRGPGRRTIRVTRRIL